MTNNDIIMDLMNYAILKNHITVLLSSELSPYTPSLAKTDDRTVIVNMNWHDRKQIPLQFAHELGHIINGDESYHPLYFSFLQSDYKVELSANRFAIEKLLPYYLKDKEADSINFNDFMTMFSIPEHLENIVQQEIKKAID